MSRLDALRTTLVLALTTGLGCSGGKTDGSGDVHSTPTADTTSDADTDSDTDSDTDTDTDSDTDADTDSDTDADTDSDTDTDTHSSTTACTPILDSRGLASGLVTCPDGSVNRATAEACDPTPPALPACPAGSYGSCTTDADCTAGPNGVCLDGGGLYQRGCGCVYTCSTDADCGAGNACICSGAVGSVSDGAWSHCAPATCATDADCPSGECGLQYTTIGIGCPIEDELACRTGLDGCRTEYDCAPEDYCASNGVSWQCRTVPPLACGRPLEVEGGHRLAPPADRPDWRDEVATQPVDDARRAALAAWWSTVGAMEHASVASFQRVALELMGLGAPPELVAGCQQAGLDEVAHARACWGLARAYGAVDAGPGPLDLSGFALRTDRREILGALIAEACVGETLSAAEVRAGADAAQDPALRALLGQVATDEEAHAALAWRTLGWMLRDADAETLTFAAATFDDALSRALAAAGPELHAPEQGVIGGAAAVALRARVAERVLRPAIRAVARS